MKLCIVGNGPSAEGHGAEIDACDFVVRIKAWWFCGAENVGQQCDALAYYGWGDWTERPAFSGEHWITQTVKQIENNPAGWDRMRFISRVSEMGILRWLTQSTWETLYQIIGSHPSTGIVAVAMGLAIVQPDELLLYGFDSTTLDKPNYWDARGPVEDRTAHNVLHEKKAIAQIFPGMWLGELTRTKLIWPDMPDGVI